MIIVILLNTFRKLQLVDTNKQGLPKSDYYDFFISYRSTDVNTVRKIADQLLASGYKVWFAEYEILLKKRASFKEAIDRGILASKYGICFTNDVYIDSEHCKDEMSQLLDLKPIENILEIQIPKGHKTYNQFPQLSSCPSISYSGNVNELLRFIEERSNLKMRPFVNLEGSSQRQTFDFLIYQYSLDLTGWEVVDRGSNIDPLTPSDSFIKALPRDIRDEWLKLIDYISLHAEVMQEEVLDIIAHGLDSISGPTCLLKINDEIISMNLYIGPELDEKARKILHNPDDRERYEDIIANTAQHHTKTLGLNVIGVHLIKANGAGQFAMSYQNSHIWTRKVSIIMESPDNDEMLEFVFTFGYKGAYEDYCLYSHIMDKVATSLKWGSHNASRNKVTSRDVSKYTRVAFYLVEAGFPRFALSCLKRAISIDPTCCDAYNEIGFIYMKFFNNATKAMQFARLASDCDPDNTKFQNSVNYAMLRLASSFKSKKELRIQSEILLENVERMINTNPAYASAYLSKACALALCGEPKSVWENEINKAKEAYLNSSHMCGGAKMTPTRVDIVIANAYNDCEKFALIRRNTI